MKRRTLSQRQSEKCEDGIHDAIFTLELSGNGDCTSTDHANQTSQDTGQCAPYRMILELRVLQETARNLVSSRNLQVPWLLLLSKFNHMLQNTVQPAITDLVFCRPDKVVVGGKSLKTVSPMRASSMQVSLYFVILVLH